MFFMRKRAKLLPQATRSNNYLRLRRYWLSELCWLRAKRRAGTASKKETKVAQRELVRIRKQG